MTRTTSPDIFYRIKHVQTKNSSAASSDVLPDRDDAVDTITITDIFMRNGVNAEQTFSNIRFTNPFKN